jgi:hypothetical protein
LQLGLNDLILLIEKALIPLGVQFITQTKYTFLLRTALEIEHL